ncbi:SDR family NAD(P)-dependent oxidoreductase [Novosphingobium mangrovi (ex Huang et al. 2023)]|uniref:SDR family NAD(P)-dependent oxidoreductase n=1 Tax=Novosphingobium mangrovi (ex Huang et al. 2023) TaxID=2976432 RepID=A0ABT2I3I1_9SPHN|nr:SDR family NAD(P)-dependent oxidoreductase [Novosphingobium mangrovi (ex Huang et al. 2023)]MCT2399364.1 SDR family NAD(P)-dependent oxidoreductase [Novosphingobium mangrovi (ex Huang et al. 2023)]
MEDKRNRIVITGGTSGIGRELVQLLATGNRLTVVGRHSERSEALLAEWPDIAFIEADLDTRNGPVAVREQVSSGPLHGLINCAAIQCTPHFTAPDFDFASIAREIAVNLTAPAELIALFLPDLLEARDPFVLNVNSGLAIVPKVDSAVYCATKAGLDSLSLSLRAQLSHTPVKVLQAFLPLVDTPMTRERGGAKLSPERAAREILAGIAQRRAIVDVGKVRWLRRIHRWAPGLAQRIIRQTG